MELDILIEDDRWHDLGLETMVRQAAEHTLAHLGLDAESAELSLLACDDTRIAVLNGDFREKPVPTNVLSWPVHDLASDTDGGAPRLPVAGPDGSIALGDIAIAFEPCDREAVELGKSLPDHVTHLIVHGVLHLLGYDHIRDRDATLMQRIEAQVLGKMGLNDPYIV